MATALRAFPVRRVAILGLGLLGASLGLALRSRELAHEIAGYDAVPAVAERAAARGAITVVCGSVPETVAGAQLVVIATPVLAVPDVLAACATCLAPDAVVTDLCSTKARVTRWAAEILPMPGRFIGGHPMAGRETSGPDAADAELFAGCAWCLTPANQTDEAALAWMSELVATLGAHPVRLDAAAHDAAVAVISHLSLVAAAALVLTAASDPQAELARTLAAGGFRDTTRVASGSPRMGRDILLTNREPVLTSLDTYLAQLHHLRDAIARSDGDALERTLGEARRVRDAWVVS